MAEPSTIARPYAEAAFRLARIHFQKDQLDDAQNALGRIHGVTPVEIKDDVEFLRANIDLATARPGGFSDEDFERFEALANLLAPLVEAIHARRMTLGLLDAFVGPRIGRRILDGQVKRGDGDRIEAAFWYSDLRGFTDRKSVV